MTEIMSRTTAVLALGLLAAAPLRAQTLDEVVAATRARHEALTRGAAAFTAEGTALGGRFSLDARRAGEDWEVVPTPGAAQDAPFNAPEMARLALQSLLTVGDALHGVQLAGEDTVRGERVHVLRLPPGARVGMTRGDITDARLLVRRGDHLVMALRMSGTITDTEGTRAMSMAIDFAEFADRGPVELPGWMRITMTGALPPLAEPQRMHLEAALEVGRAALATTPAEARARTEAFLTLLEGMLHHDRVEVVARVEAVAPSPPAPLP